MSGIEDYIRENIADFDMHDIPAGSKDVFLKKMKDERRHRGLRITVSAISSMAAAAAIVLSIVPQSLASELEKHHRRLALKETEILTMISEIYPEDLDEVLSTIRAVTSEAVPLEEQLPDELEVKSKKHILKEYYDSKYKALELIMDQYMKQIKTDRV